MITVIRKTTTTVHHGIVEIRIRPVKDTGGETYFTLELVAPEKYDKKGLKGKTHVVATEPYATSLALAARILQLTADNGPITL